MKALKGSRTEKNILTAFAGESQDRNRYAFFAGKAKSEGLVQIADVFLETAEQEKEHARRLFRFLEGGEVEIAAAFPAGIIGVTEANLLASAAVEFHKYAEMYPTFAGIANEEGFDEIAVVMQAIAAAEAYHEKRFLAFAKNIKEGRVFIREQSITWRCLNCGCILEGRSAPEACPACESSQAYFEVARVSW
jgi:rubrerythrin